MFLLITIESVVKYLDWYVFRDKIVWNQIPKIEIDF